MNSQHLANHICNRRSSSSFPPGCNSSFIALIPKSQEAKMVKDFCPISLIGNYYPGVSTKANALIFKIGFEKTFDSVRWDYLDVVLANFGFGLKLRMDAILSVWIWVGHLDDGSNSDGTGGGDECAGGAVHLARRSPAKGDDSEIGGDSDGVVMAKSLSTSASTGRDMEA
ncbi:hypothetical protein Tco_1155611 [Tanacetum coccineum]